ncbi:hypothetical protein BH09ACT8_BH09ACT8_18120 [soil metagenome]
MKVKYIGALVIATAATIVAASPVSADVTVEQHPGHAEIIATPGAAVKRAAQLQHPFGDAPFLVFHH